MYKPFTNLRFQKHFKVTYSFIFSMSLLLFCCKDKGGTITVPGEQLGAQHYADWPGLANSPWPMFMHDPQHTGRSPYKGPQIGAVQWRFDATSFVYSSPVIDEDGTIYVGDHDGNFYAINQDGSLKWKYQTLGRIITSALISSDGTIYVAGGSLTDLSAGLLYAFDREGNNKWTYQLQGFSSFSDPTISKDGKTVYIITLRASNDSSWLDAIKTDGTLRWSVTKEGDDLFNEWAPAFSEDGTVLYLPGINNLFAIDTSGTQLWKFYTGTYGSSPCVDNEGNISFVADKFYTLNSSGILRWSKVGGSGNEPQAPSIGWDGTIYASTGESGSRPGYYVHAYTQDGALKWMQYVGFFSQCNPISDIDGNVYLGSIGRMWTPDSTNFYGINADGSYKFKMILRSPDGSIPDIDSRPAIGLGENLYVGCDQPRGYHVFAIH